MRGWADAILDFDTGLYQEIMDSASEQIGWNERFRPKIVYVDAEYAMYVEHGTRPAAASMPNDRPRGERWGGTGTGYRHSPYHSVAYENLKKWVHDKLGIQDETEWLRASYRIYRHIMTQGIAPMPFAESALNDTVWAIDHGQFDFNDTSVTTDTIAAYLMSRMEFHLTNTVFDQGQCKQRQLPPSWTGHLMSTVHVEDGMPGDPTISVNILSVESDEDIATRFQSELEGLDGRA